jgi:hypothetical protein
MVPQRWLGADGAALAASIAADGHYLIAAATSSTATATELWPKRFVWIVGPQS